LLIKKRSKREAYPNFSFIQQFSPSLPKERPKKEFFHLRQRARSSEKLYTGKKKKKNAFVEVAKIINKFNASIAESEDNFRLILLSGSNGFS
jgi:hypothetical protein